MKERLCESLILIWTLSWYEHYHDMNVIVIWTLSWYEHYRDMNVNWFHSMSKSWLSVLPNEKSAIFSQSDSTCRCMYVRTTYKVCGKIIHFKSHLESQVTFWLLLYCSLLKLINCTIFSASRLVYQSGYGASLSYPFATTTKTWLKFTSTQTTMEKGPTISSCLSSLFIPRLYVYYLPTYTNNQMLKWWKEWFWLLMTKVKVFLDLALAHDLGFQVISHQHLNYEIQS